jgi:hypothetical protein
MLAKSIRSFSPSSSSFSGLKLKEFLQKLRDWGVAALNMMANAKAEFEPENMRCSNDSGVRERQDGLRRLATCLLSELPDRILDYSAAWWNTVNWDAVAKALPQPGYCCTAPCSSSSDTVSPAAITFESHHE